MNYTPSKEMGIRRGLLVFVAIVTAVVQNTPGFNLDFAGLSPMLAVPFVVSIAMYERSLGGLVFGFIAGVFWDFVSYGADGMFTLLLTLIGFSVGALTTFYLRNRLVTAVLLSFVSCTGVSVAYWLIFILRKGYDGMWEILFTHFIPLAVYSALFIFVYYYLVGFIIKSTGKADGAKRIYFK